MWALEPHYNLARADVGERALAVAHTDGLILPELDIVTDALLAYAQSSVDFIDAYSACWTRQRGLSRVATFDKKHYSRLEGIAIHTPGKG